MKRKIIGILVCILFLSVTIPTIAAGMKENDKFSKISFTLDEQEIFGVYQGFIIGKISNVDKSGSKITFYAISITIFPGRHHLAHRDARLDRPYFGIITSKFICVIGTVYSGW